MTGDHRRTQLLIQKTFPAPKECFLVLPLHQINLTDDSSQRCFRCRFDKPGLQLLLVFSEVLPCCGLLQLPVVNAFVFQQPIGIGLEIRLARGPDIPAHVKRDPWGRGCSGVENASRQKPLHMRIDCEAHIQTSG